MNARPLSLDQDRDVPTVPRRDREHVSLRVIDPPSSSSRSILVLPERGTVFLIGDGPPVSYDCGTCSSPLLVDIKAEQVTNTVLLCNNCGSYNESPS